jgi:hypothetical protein
MKKPLNLNPKFAITLAKAGYYGRMWKMQADGLLPEKKERDQ